MRRRSVVSIPYLISAALFSSLICAGPSHAMVATPLVSEMENGGSKSKTVVRVTNDGAQKLPVEFKFSRIEVDENGGTTFIPSEGEFKVFPPQFSIEPGKTQSFHVQWVGKKPLEKSANYILSINQLPIKFPNAQTGVQVVYNVSVILNVAPPNAEAALQVISSAVTKDATGKARPAMLVQNSGTRHVRLADRTIRLESGAWRAVLTPAQLQQSIGVGLVQAGKRRKFVLPVDLPAGVTSVTATIDSQGAISSLSK